MDIKTINPVSGAGKMADTALPQTAIPKNDAETDYTAKKDRKPNERGLSFQDAKDIAEGMNGLMDVLNHTSIGFSIREELNHQIVVEIKDRETDELIRQIPAEELLAIKEKMEEVTGLIFDQKA
ncbi:flagellar protein FlaG [Desulfospira joergensenii]|uniref:flagellar protein FlaG n=1 Tax=Desulfospira joergensenii TaxID=53329 RepID=UPI0003B58D8C|nr:flagellar protein FlaG [Desulfospira joergensenii]